MLPPGAIKLKQPYVNIDQLLLNVRVFPTIAVFKHKVYFPLLVFAQRSRVSLPLQPLSPLPLRLLAAALRFFVLICAPSVLRLTYRPQVKTDVDLQRIVVYNLYCMFFVSEFIVRGGCR